MKRNFLVFVSCLLLLTLTACEKAESMEESITIVTEEIEKIEESVEVKTEAMEAEADESSDAEMDLYVGEYHDYDADEPMLQIQKENDGTYKIQIGIFRLIQLDQCVGQLTAKGIEFSTTELGDRDISGIITLEDEGAKVTFTGSGWSDYSDVNEYTYRKTSDIPNIYEY